MTHKTKLMSEARPFLPPCDHTNEPLTIEPITITIAETCRITGYGPTTVWKLIKQGKIRVLRLEEVRRTLPYLASVNELLAPQPPPTKPMSAEPRPKRGRGRPRELPQPTSSG
jgi:hypothetical protein